jgi:hypothetical protein
MLHETDHMELFEKENAFNKVFSEIYEYCPALKVPVLRCALEKIALPFTA